MKAAVRAIPTVCTFVMLLTACTDQQVNNQSKPTRPSKLKVAVIEKVKSANIGMDQATASCVVEDMLAGDVYDLNAINQMKLSGHSISDHPKDLLETYHMALKHCQ
ncbi:hypothetical protein [Marinicella litoralis]|uniref:Lipoprotein n=1 Tax=Marinicella litoralis TaxID=644220 RepID=A0A4R6XXV3_9GAMM|nr:hypothetical protein [Marinicella litoralis]TDR23449.1 hypothetical protein C8D91_0310 [Marinicella litoralis]